MAEVSFEHLGWFHEYFVGGKFIGTKICSKDREEIGYYGRKSETLNETITLDNGKKIKAGVYVTTTLYPLCGKKSQIQNL